MSVLELYLMLSVAPKLAGLSIPLGALASLGVVVLFAIQMGLRIDAAQYGESSQIKAESTIKLLQPYYRSVCIMAISSWLVFITMPDRDNIYLLVGAAVVTNIEGIDKLPDNLVGAANTFLETYNKSE